MHPLHPIDFAPELARKLLTRSPVNGWHAVELWGGALLETTDPQNAWRAAFGTARKMIRHWIGTGRMCPRLQAVVNAARS